MTNTVVYILKLENNKYYIGRTNNFEKRKLQHINGNASYWTKKHRFVSVEKIMLFSSIYDEDRYTKEYMYIHGIDNVRGGAYSSIILDEEKKKFIEKELRNANDLCIQCGSDKHFVKYCKEQNNNICYKINYFIYNFIYDFLNPPIIDRPTTLF